MTALEPARSRRVPPRLDVVIAVLDHRDLPQVLLELEFDQSCRLIVVQPGNLAEDRSKPGVAFLRCPTRNIFELWAAGIREASADYVAVLDARCPPSPTWLRAVYLAIDEAAESIYGPVVLDEVAFGAQSAEYLIEYAQFARPVAQSLREVPGNNFAFKRALLDRETLSGKAFHKVFFVARLQAEGRPPAYRDLMEVRYRKRYDRMHFLLRRFAHGRTFASCRIRHIRPVMRWSLTAGLPALPPLRLWRALQAVQGKPRLINVYLANFWYLIMSEIAWSAGEAAGYLSGRPGNAKYLD